MDQATFEMMRRRYLRRHVQRLRGLLPPALREFYSLFNNSEIDVLNHILPGGTALTQPTGTKLGLHRATTLSAEATSGQNQISVPFAIAVGVEVILNPNGGGAAETFTSTAQGGAGPYTITLSGNLAATHASGVLVSFRPHEDGTGINEPTGVGNYARLTFSDWTAATTNSDGKGERSNNTLIQFAAFSADIGYVTDVVVFKSDDTKWMRGKLNTPVKQFLTDDVLEFAANALKITMD